MKVVIATDSYKGSLTSIEAGEAIKNGIINFDSNIDVVVRAVSDGGEGTSYALTDAQGGEMVSLWVTGPSGNKVRSSYGIVNAGEMAIIEMAEASGLSLVKKGGKNPLFTTTYGTGEMILDAIKRGCRRFLIGIGGSATNDGGTGMLSALGFEFLDVQGNPISPGAIGLKDLSKIEKKNVIPELAESDFMIACDVNNPLCGKMGCSEVYGAQKGATPEMIKNMDLWLSEYAELTKTINPHTDANVPGCGAAGGLGFAFLWYLNGQLKPGIDLILEILNLENDIKDADIVITGEGRLDSQSAMGKTPTGVARIAKQYGKKVLAFAGCVSEDAKVCNEKGIDAFFSVVPGAVTLEEAMKSENARKNITSVTEQVFRAMLL